MIVCKPADPEDKGLVERAHDYLERSFLPGRTFTEPGDFNTQLQRLAARRQRPAAPGAGLRADRPDRRGPPGRCCRCRRSRRRPDGGTSTRLARDHYVRLDSNDYSVHPARDRPPHRGHRRPATGSGPSATARPSPTTNGSGPGTRPSPTPSTSRPPRSLRRTRVGALRPAATAPPSSQVEQRPLSDYDTALGIDRPTEHRRRVRVMAARKATATTARRRRDLTAEVAFLTRALKAPTLRECGAPAGRTRPGRVLDARGVPGRLPATRGRRPRVPRRRGPHPRRPVPRPASRLEEFDFDHARGLKRDLIAHLGTLDFVAARENVVFLGPPGTGKTHLATGLGDPRLPGRPPGPVRHRHPVGRPARRGPPRRQAPSTSSSGSAATRCWSSTRSATSPSSPRPPTCSSSSSPPATNAPR